MNNCKVVADDIKVEQIGIPPKTDTSNTHHLQVGPIMSPPPPHSKSSGRRWSTISGVIAIENEANIVPEDVDNNLDLSSKEVSFWRRYLGIFFTLLSSCCLSLAAIIIKALENIHPLALASFRFAGLIIPSVIIITYHHNCIKSSTVIRGFLALEPKQKRKTGLWLLIRAVVGTISVMGYFYSVKLISVGDVAVIGFSSPIMIIFLAYFFLKEPFSIIQLGTCFISLIGVFIISRPPFLTGGKSFDSTTLIGIGCALGSMAFMSFIIILLRFLRSTHYLLITFCFGIWGFIQCTAVSMYLDVFDIEAYNNSDWILVGCLCFLTFFQQTFLTLALKYEQSGIVSLVRCLDVVFAFIFQFLFLGKLPDIFSIIGAVIVISAVILICIRKFLLEMNEDSKLRKSLWFLTK